MTDQELKDRLEINDLLVTYSNALSRRDWETWRSVFTPDAALDFATASGPVAGVDEVQAWVQPSLEVFDVVLPALSNVQICFESADRATVRSMYRMVMRLPGADGGQPTYLEAAGWYDDVVVRTGDGWRLAERTESLGFVRA